MLANAAMGDIEELIDLVLTGAHPKLRERCFVDQVNFDIQRAFKNRSPLGRPPQFLISAHESGPNSPANS